LAAESFLGAPLFVNTFSKIGAWALELFAGRELG
jgi:hypothetical protein